MAEKIQEVQEKKSIELINIPTDYEVGFRTPNGDMYEKDYLAWLGNEIIELKKAIAG